MDLKYIDIHSHLGFEDYGADKALVLNRMKEAHVGTIAIGADLETSREAVKVATENENIWACIGQHPIHNNIEVTHGSLDFDEEEFEKLINNPKVVAIGECGLEYYKLEGDVEKIKARQKEVFIKQIEFAIKYNKALMLHIRDVDKKNEINQGFTLIDSAFEDAYEILKRYEGRVKGNLHFFTGKLAVAQKFIDLGFTISFTGLITYIEDFNKTIKALPLESIQAETDAPYVAPVPYRGKRNEPTYVIEVYKKIAEIRGEDPETVRLQLLENAKRVFGV
jgi:TatD DNase family protein